MTSNDTKTNENTQARIAEIDQLIAELTAERRTLVASDRLAPYDVSAQRRESLERAVELGADDETLALLAGASRLQRRDHLRVETRYGGLSRGRAWGRQGRGDNVRWADKDGGVVLLTPGRWTVGSSDGYRRKESPENWDVRHVRVGSKTWTIGE